MTPKEESQSWAKSHAEAMFELQRWLFKLQNTKGERAFGFEDTETVMNFIAKKCGYKNWCDMGNTLRLMSGAEVIG